MAGIASNNSSTAITSRTPWDTFGSNQCERKVFVFLVTLVTSASERNPFPFTSMAVHISFLLLKAALLRAKGSLALTCSQLTAMFLLCFVLLLCDSVGGLIRPAGVKRWLAAGPPPLHTSQSQEYYEHC